MAPSRNGRFIIASDLGALILLALGLVLVHTATNGQYRFHRDQLAVVDEARHLTMNSADGR